MTVKEFRELGILQEVNRLFLHPMGLALEVIVGEDGSERFGEVWDFREDPLGLFFPEGTLDPEKAKTVHRMRYAKLLERSAEIGGNYQDIP